MVTNLIGNFHKMNYKPIGNAIFVETIKTINIGLKNVNFVKILNGSTIKD